MRKSNRNKFKPYLRRANGDETAEGFRMAIRLAYYQGLGRPFYVMVQRGFPNCVMEVAGNKRDLRQTALSVALGLRSFRSWASNVQKRARGW